MRTALREGDEESRRERVAAAAPVGAGLAVLTERRSPRREQRAPASERDADELVPVRELLHRLLRLGAGQRPRLGGVRDQHARAHEGVAPLGGEAGRARGRARPPAGGGQRGPRRSRRVGVEECEARDEDCVSVQTGQVGLDEASVGAAVDRELAVHARDRSRRRAPVAREHGPDAAGAEGALEHIGSQIVSDASHAGRVGPRCGRPHSRVGSGSAGTEPDRRVVDSRAPDELEVEHHVADGGERDRHQRENRPDSCILVRMPYDLADFDVDAVRALTAELRALPAAPTVEDDAQVVAEHLRDALVGPDGGPALALARVYKTERFERISADLQEFAAGVLGEMPEPGVRCLTLLGTAGDEPAWNDRTLSSGHRAIPLPSEQFVERLPMVAGLIRNLGLDLGVVVTAPEGHEARELAGRTNNVFHVAEAVDDPWLPAQEEFIVPYAIRSAVGFGGILLTGDFFAVVLFSRVPVSEQVARTLKILAQPIAARFLPFAVRVLRR